MNRSGCSVSRLLILSAWIIFSNFVLFAQNNTITILYTNDMHANFTPHEASWIQETPKPLIGGMNELSWIVDSIRKVKSTTLLLDAGDVMTGNPITEYMVDGAKGGALFDMMNRVGYDAWTPGNHDFDISSANLRNLAAVANFPTVSANIIDTAGNFPVDNKEYCIIEKNGLKIGIIGIMSDDFYNLVNQKSVRGIKILSPIETAQRLVERIALQTDLIIALTHQGFDDDSILAMHVPKLNVIVGGHSHTRLTHPKKINGVLIVQSGSNAENLGVLDLIVANHQVSGYGGKLLPLWYNPNRAATPLSLFIDSLKNEIERDYGEILGTLKNDWIRRNGESGIGNFITDALREAAGADFSLMNNHGIRKDVAAGPITKRRLFEVLPFHDVLVKFEITGKQVRKIVQFELENGPVMQTSGIRCTWRHSSDGTIEFMSFLIKGKPLKDDAIYTGATCDYLICEMPKYFDFELQKITYYTTTVIAAVENKIRKSKEISSVLEYRIKQDR
jgi:5'-nucleotidase / UDP-sugar diphosphatase